MANLSLLLCLTATLALFTPVTALGPPRHGLISKRQILDVDPDLLYPTQTIEVPIDHFQNSSLYEPHVNDTFFLRYWFDASHYKDGGPVFLLQGGETDGSERLPYLQKGILAKLAAASHGVGVVIEHRYYGESWPFGDDSLKTENLRFLTTEQALADSDYVARNIVFKGLEDKNLTAPGTAWIGYGGSYAGGYSAFLRTQYPHTFWGAIASSGVVEAIWDYWQYWEPIMTYGPPKCIKLTQKLVNVMDRIIIGVNNQTITDELKGVFGLGNLTDNVDFVSLLSGPFEYWQGRNWDHSVNDSEPFYEYCGNITTDGVIHPETYALVPTVKSLLEISGIGDEAEGGHPIELYTLIEPFLNMIGFFNQTSNAQCGNQTADECWHTTADWYANDDIDQTWRSWQYQVCTEWGYLTTGSGFPDHKLPLVSRLLDLDYEALPCVYGFNITTPANVSMINRYGGYDISYPRLAFIDGEQDPWRPATVHASPYIEKVENRSSTARKPFILIKGAVHHWDENGLFKNETMPGLPPVAIKETHHAEIMFVMEWLQEWECAKAKKETDQYLEEL